jgi:hypothetical protein
MSTLVLMLIAAGGSILLGLPYLVRAFGPTEAEVVSWGRVAITTGIALAALVLLLWRQRHHQWTRIALSLGYGWLALLQVLPIVLWLLFHGMGISDGSPPSPFSAHWAYALPHLALFVLSVFILRQLPRN